jgi:geranylgeranyl diphosphate synthase, type I
MFDRFQSQITRDIAFFFKDYQSWTNQISSFGRENIDVLLPFVTSGKMIRGCLFLFCCELFDMTNTHIYVGIASALEMAHSALLIHDDLIDNSRLRRGKPTVAVQYREYGQQKHLNNVRHFGDNQALILGDLSYILSYRRLASTPIPASKLSPILTCFSDELSLVELGQMSDNYWSNTRQFPKELDILTYYRYKTARYTFSLPFRLAGIMTQQPQSTIKKLITFGETMGLLFQLTDDTLGIFGDEKRTGKPVGSDIAEGKKTLYMFHLHKQLLGKVKQQFLKIFGKGKVSHEELTFIRNLIHTTGTEKSIENKIARLTLEAEKSISNLPIPENRKEKFRKLLTYLRSRTK